MLRVGVPALPACASPGVSGGAQLSMALQLNCFGLGPCGFNLPSLLCAVQMSLVQQEAMQFIVLPAAQDTHFKASQCLSASSDTIFRVLSEHQSKTWVSECHSSPWSAASNVSYLLSSLAALQAQPLSSIPFTLSCQFTRSALLAAVLCPTAQHSQLCPSGRSFSNSSVPPG